MIDDKPLDYVIAAIVYAAVNSSDFRENVQSVIDVQKHINSHYNSEIPTSAINAALRHLQSIDLAEFLESKFAPPVVRFSPNFQSQAAVWRFEKASTASRILDRFMDGPYNWLEDVFRMPAFRDGLANQSHQFHLEPQAPLQSVTWTGLSNRYVVSASTQDRIVIRLREIETVVDTLDLSQSERSQVSAALAASIILSEAPTPPWPIILTLLSAAGGIAALASGVTDVIHLVTSG